MVVGKVRLRAPENTMTSHPLQLACHPLLSQVLWRQQLENDLARGRIEASILHERSREILKRWRQSSGLPVVSTSWERVMTTKTNTDQILRTMFSRLLHLEIDEQQARRLSSVIDSVMERVGGNFDLETVQGQNTFRALLCSMVVHGWGNGMHPFHNPTADLEGQSLEVRVSKDILVGMADLQALRYVKKDAQGRVRKALFEPDQNQRVRQQIDDILSEVSRQK
jgi:hypothetical protein